MAVLIVPACFSAADHKTAVRDTAVVTVQLFLGNEMYRCIILVKVVRHGLDLFLDACKISTFLSNYEALSCMFLACSKLRIFSVSYCLKCSFYRNGVLLCILYAFDAADCIRMSLADTLAPECVVVSICKDRICIHTVQRKHSWIPAYGNDSYMSTLCCCLVNICKMLRDFLMCIKAIHNIEIFYILRCLNRKICRTSSTDDQDIDLILQLLRIFYRINLCGLCKDLYSLWITSGKYCNQLCIRIMLDGALHAASQVSVT